MPSPFPGTNPYLEQEDVWHDFHERWIPLVDLQAVLQRIYDAAGHEDYVYAGTPQPPLAPDDAAWAKQLVAGLPGR